VTNAPRLRASRPSGTRIDQILAGAALRVLAPLDGFGCPTPRGLVSCRSRPGAAPPELSLPGEPCSLSRASASLRVRSSDRTRRGARRFFTTAFPGSRRLESRDDGSSQSLVRSPRRTRRHAARSVRSPRTPGSPCTTGTPASKLCSPRGSVPHAPRLGQTRNWRPVLSWGCRPPELSPPRSGFGHSRRRTRGARCPCRIRRQESSRRGCRPRSGLRPRAHEPGIRRCATS